MKRNKIYFIIIFLLINPFNKGTASAQQDESFTSKIDSLLKPWNSDKTPGCIVGIVQNGKVIFEKAYGMADIENNKQITSETKFNIASVSKQFTCTAIMLLQEQGKLGLDDEIHKYLPELPHYITPVTIRQLMNHTSGIMEHFVFNYLNNQTIAEDQLSFNDVYDLILKYQYLSFKSGEQFFYCNSNFVLLAKIIERVSNQSFPLFIQNNIFKTLDMGESFVITDVDEYKQVAPEYIMPENNKDAYKPFNTSGAVYGSTSVVTTIKDMYKWTNNFYYNKLGKANPQLFVQMAKPGILNNGDTIQYGFGFMTLKYKGLTYYYHGGSTGCSVLHIPSQKLSIIILGNNGEDRIPEQHIYDISEIILESNPNEYINPFANYKDSIKTNAGLYAKGELKAYEGVYYDFFNNDNFQIIFNEEKLYLFDMELLPLQKNHFTLNGSRIVEIIFTDTLNLSINSYTWEKHNYSYPIKKMYCTKVREQILTEELFKKIIGKYQVKGFDKIFELSKKDDMINMSQWNRDFKPVCENTFLSQRFTLHFIYDKSAEIIGFTLSSAKFANLQFDKILE